MSHLEVRAKTGEDKEGKAIYRTIGRVITTQKGQMLKLDSIPLLWDGWAYLNEPREPDQKPQQRPAQRQPGRGGFDRDDDIPY